MAGKIRKHHKEDNVTYSPTCRLIGVYKNKRKRKKI